MNITDSKLMAICATFGISPTETNIDQLRVLMRAMHIFTERNTLRQDLWREDGIIGCAMQCKSKALRLMQNAHAPNVPLADPDEAIDDGLDLINYAAFFIRSTDELDS